MNFFISSESGETCAGQSHLEVKTVLNSKCWWILMWEDNIGTDKALLWIMDLYFDQKRRFKVKMPSRWICCLQRHFTLLHKTLIGGLLWITRGLLWCFYQLFGRSFWRHPFTAEDPLVSKGCDATFLQICFDEETTSSTSWMARAGVDI